MIVNARAQLLVAAASAMAVACAGPRSRPLPRSPETRAAVARPEPDPACHGAVQGLLARNALDVVTVKLSLDDKGRIGIVEVLSPDLTPAAKIELQRAFASCAWAPLPAGGQVELFTTTWAREQAAR